MVGKNEGTALEPTAVRRQLLNLLREAVQGPAGPSTYFIDNRPGAGLLNVLAGLSAAEASRPVGGTTIAAHVHHVAFAMEVSAAAVQGRHPSTDWNESWRVAAADEAEWRRLVDELRRQYEGLRRAVESGATSDEQAFGEAIGVVAHIAYHLGAIRQKMVALPSK